MLAPCRAWLTNLTQRAAAAARKPSSLYSCNQLTRPTKVKGAARPQIDACHSAGCGAYTPWVVRTKNSFGMHASTQSRSLYIGSGIHAGVVTPHIHLGSVYEVGALAACAPWCHPRGSMLNQNRKKEAFQRRYSIKPNTLRFRIPSIQVEANIEYKYLLFDWIFDFIEYLHMPICLFYCIKHLKV